MKNPRVFLPLGVLLILVSLRFVLFATEPWMRYSNAWSRDRLREALHALETDLPNSPPPILFFGTSEIESGFDPLAFDARLHERGFATTSWNLAVRNVRLTDTILIRRIRADLKKRDLKPPILFLHVPISRLTKTAASSSRERSKNHDLTAVAFDPSIDLDLDLSDRLTLLLNKYVLGERSLMQLGVFGRELRERFKGDNRADPIRQLWYSSTFQATPAWDPARRGLDNWNVDREREAFTRVAEQLSSAPLLRMNLRSQNDCCDFFDMKIDPRILAETAAELKALQGECACVVLVNPPENPWLKRTPESWQRKISAFEELARLSGAPTLDLSQDSSLTQDDFLDIIHFNQTGVQKFAADLARMTAERFPDRLVKTESK